VTGAGAMSRLVEMFGEWDLPAPPIPPRFGASLHQVEPQCFATNGMASAPMYLFEAHLPLQLLQGRIDDFVAVSFAGHGANSYGLSYFLVDGPLALFLQTAWGGVYTDAHRAGSAWRLLVSQVERLLHAAEPRRRAAACDPSERLLVISSDFRGTGTWALVRTPLGEDAAGPLVHGRRPDARSDLNGSHQQALIAATEWAESTWLPQPGR